MRKEEKVTGKYQLTVKDKHTTLKRYRLLSASEKASIMFDIRHKKLLINCGGILPPEANWFSFALRKIYEKHFKILENY